MQILISQEVQANLFSLVNSVLVWSNLCENVFLKVMGFAFYNYILWMIQIGIFSINICEKPILISHIPHNNW